MTRGEKYALYFSGFALLNLYNLFFNDLTHGWEIAFFSGGTIMFIIFALLSWFEVDWFVKKPSEKDPRCRCAHPLSVHWKEGHKGCFVRDIIDGQQMPCPCGKFEERQT